MERIDPQHLVPDGLVRPRALIVDDDVVGRISLRKLLTDCGYAVELAQDGAQGFERFEASRPDIVFMDMLMPVMDGLESTRLIKRDCGDDFVPVIFITGNSDEHDLARCIEAGGDDFLVKPYSKSILIAKIRAMERIRALHQRTAALHAMLQEEQHLAKSILEGAIMTLNVRPPGLSAHLAPATTFNGDLLLSAYSPAGDLHVLLGDFTGHGLAATIGALPASEIFRAMTAKGFEPAQILAEINRKLRALLPTGRFLAAVFLRLGRDMGRLSVINCGMPEAWLFRGVSRLAAFRSEAVPLAVMPEIDFAAAEVSHQVMAGDRIVLVSDGAIEVGNAGGGMLGVDGLCAAIESGLADGRPLAAAVNAIDSFRDGLALSDDASLVEVLLDEALFPPLGSVPGVYEVRSRAVPGAEAVGGAGWRVLVELRRDALREANPVPLLMSLLKEFPGAVAESPFLFTVLAELYNNALDHGVLRLDSQLKSEDFSLYLDERERRLADPGEGCVSLELDCSYRGSSGRLNIRVADNGAGFDPARVVAAGAEALHGRGIALVQSVCESLDYEAGGRVACATYAWDVDTESVQ
jgi:CheY-like chemotaxis protein